MDSVRYDGIDVSHFQGDVDWPAVKAAGKEFVFIKATEGDRYVDPRFQANWAGAKAAGLVRGAYHFFQPQKDAAAQAAHFLATVELEPGDLPPALDVEVTESVSARGIDRAAVTWLEQVEAACGATPILYSDLSFLEQYLGLGFGRYPLWLADYSETAPAAPAPWTAWTFWQSSQSGRVTGITGAVDLDVFEGRAEDWNGLRIG